MNRFTPNGRPVSARVCPICSRTTAADLYPAARNPIPPASQTAATSAGVDPPPAIGACTTSGNITPLPPAGARRRTWSYRSGGSPEGVETGDRLPQDQLVHFFGALVRQDALQVVH